MARIAGIDLPKNKRGEIGLTYIFGIGRSNAQRILDVAGVDRNKKVQDWNDDEQNKIRAVINDSFKIEGALRSEVQMNIKRLKEIQCCPARYGFSSPLETDDETVSSRPR